VVGGWRTTTGEFHGYITGQNGKGGTDLDSLSPAAINDSGQVVGELDTSQGRRAFITGPNGKDVTVLATLGQPESFAYAINNSGQVVGVAGTWPVATQAFITGPDGAGMANLAVLAGGDTRVGYTHANAINDSGVVAGTAGNFVTLPHAFITGPNGVGMTDLNSLVDLPDGVVLFEAIDLNNQGQVIAMGSVVPEPEHYALLLAGLALMGLLVRRTNAEGRAGH
jgi:probable HAF family extracellular repeat protein